MAGFGDTEWTERIGVAAAGVSYGDMSDDSLSVLADVLPALGRAACQTDRNSNFLSAPAVPYDIAAKLFAAISPAHMCATGAFLSRPDIPTADAARIVASERRLSVLRQVAELEGRDPAVYEAVVSAFGKTTQTKPPSSGFSVLLALLTNPDVPLVSKAAAAAVPSAHAWARYASSDSSVYACWDLLMESSEQLQAAAFDGLSLPDSILLDCASWQCLSTVQLRTVFAALQRQAVPETGLTPGDGASGTCRRSGFADPDRLPGDLLDICDHAAATDEFLTEVDDWFDTFPFPDLESVSVAFFWFTYRKHRRQGQHRVAVTEFWAAHPEGPLEQLTLLDWSRWTRIGSVSELVEVLAVKPDGWRDIPVSGWLVSPLTPLLESASSAELLAGLAAAAAADMPSLLADVEELCWMSASYDALTFDVLRRLRQPLVASSFATMRLLELFAATLGPGPESWEIFEKVSAPDASIGEVLDLVAHVLDSDTP